MSIDDLITKLLMQGNWQGDDGFDKEYLKTYLVDILSDYFDIYYDATPESYWNEDHTVYKDPIDFPDEYLEFLFQSQRESIQLGGPYGMTVFGWPRMLIDTLNWMKIHQGDVEGQRYWINVAERGDKGFIYMCCDTKSKLYGLVVEFYDGAPWNSNCSLPDDKTDGDVYGTFSEFLELTLNGKGL